MNIDLHIEQLILDQGAPGDRERVAASVRRELARLIAEGGLSTSLLKGADIARIDGGTLQTAQGNSAESLGPQIAQAIYEGMTHD